MIYEIWKDIPGYEGLYQVSNLGRVKTLSRYVKYKNTNRFRKGRIMKSKLENCGYYRICLNKDSHKKLYLINRLVASAFLGLDLNDLTIQVNHKDWDKTNNNFDNLELTTKRENLSYHNRKTTSKYVGVSYFSNTNKWRSRIVINKKTIYLGHYYTEQEAHQAYLEALEKYGIKNKYATKIKETI